MAGKILRFLKRAAVLLPALAIAYFSIHDIFPFLDKRTPQLVAFLITYILAAYVLVPTAARLARLLSKPRHLPIYSVTPDGYASDPVNIGIIGSRSQLEQAMHQAGWVTADSKTFATSYRLIAATLFGLAYAKAPMSSLYLMGRKQDIGFEMQPDGKVSHRHHVRFWATTFDQDDELTANSIHWFRRRKESRAHQRETLLWLGAASKDSGLALIRHNAQLTHMIHHDTNKERDLIVSQLTKHGAKLEATLWLRQPYRLTNRALSGYLQTDGRLKVVRLTKPTDRRSLHRNRSS